MNKYIKIGGTVLLCACAIGILWTSSHNKKDVLDGAQKKSTEQNTEVETIVSFPNSYEKQVSDTFVIQADVIVPENFKPNNLHKATAKIIEIDQEKWKKHFLKEGVIYEEDEWDDLSRESEMLIGREYENGDWQLTVASQCGNLWTPVFYHIDNCLVWDTVVADGYNRDVYPLEGDLEFASRKEVYQNITTELENLGIPMKSAEIERCYSLPYQTLAEQEKQNLEIGNLEQEDIKGAWSREDDAYYFYIWQKEQGLPIYPDGYIEWIDPENVRGGIRCCYNKDGMVSLNVAYWMECKQEKEKLSLLPLEDIMKAVEEKYGQVINDSMMTLKTCRLFEAPIPRDDNNYEVVPVWICEIQNDENTVPVYLPINAVTGQEVNELEGEW